MLELFSNNLVLVVILAVFVLASLLAFLLLRPPATDVNEERIQQERLAWQLQERETRVRELEGSNLRLEERERSAQQSLTEAKVKISELETLLSEQRRMTEEKLRVYGDVENRFKELFTGLSAEALKSNSMAFIEYAKVQFSQLQQGAKEDLETRQNSIFELVKPIRESLEKMDTKFGELEGERKVQHAKLEEQLKQICSAEQGLKDETRRLSEALRKPSVRGRWGEIQLRRVVEYAGMVEHCDFEEQGSVETEDSRLRPDLVVHLPNGKEVVIDSKTPLQAYLEALDAPDELTRTMKLREHARQVRNHITMLAGKSYWAQFQHSPEFVVLFLPAESFYSAALEQDPELLEFGARDRVILATPTTLIALLKAVAYGWRQERITQHAEEISKIGKDVYERSRKLVDHFSKLRRALDTAVGAYNDLVGSFEGRVLVTLRRLKELGTVHGDEIPKLENVEKIPRELTEMEVSRIES